MGSGSMARSPTLKMALPPDMLTVFTKACCDAILGLQNSPAAGTTYDLSDASVSAADIIRAAFHGQCSYDDAALELTSRLMDATEQINVNKIQGAIEMLKSKSSNDLHANLHASQGVYTFIWAKVGQYHVMMKKGVVKLSTSVKSAATDLTATIHYPNSESEFYCMLNDWIYVISAVGLVGYGIAYRFFKDIIEYGMQKLKLGYKVTNCLFLLYLKRVETDPNRSLSLATVFREASVDTLISEAKINAEAFFRPRGGTPQPGSGDDECNPCDDDGTKPIKKATVTWNGKFNASSTKCCATYNWKDAKHAKTSLAQDGTCKFLHASSTSRPTTMPPTSSRSPCTTRQSSLRFAPSSWARRDLPTRPRARRRQRPPRAPSSRVIRFAVRTTLSLLGRSAFACSDRDPRGGVQMRS